MNRSFRTSLIATSLAAAILIAAGCHRSSVAAGATAALVSLYKALGGT